MIYGNIHLLKTDTMNLFFTYTKVLICFCVAGVHYSSFSQVLYPVNSVTDTIYFSVGSKDDKLSIQSLYLPDAGKFPEIKSLELRDADLHLQFYFSRKSQKYSPAVVTLQSIYDSKGELILPPYFKLTNIEIKPNHPVGERIWQDALEDFLTPNHEYKLVIERSLMENIDCSKPEPKFDVSQQWPHFAIAAASIISIGIGNIYLNQRDDLYDSYQQDWINGYTTQLADPNFLEAKKYNKKASAWINSGLAVLSADIVIYSYRWMSFNKKKNLFKKFCESQSSFGFKLIPNLEGEKTGMFDVSIKF